MDKTDKCALDVDGGGVSGDSHTNQQPQSSEQDEKVNLSEFSKELLEQILIHLDDERLLTASHVCKSFAAAAESAFAQNYANESYNFYEAQKSFDKVVVTKYGDKMRKILVQYGDTELLHLIEQKCCNLKNASFQNVKRIPRLMGLKEANVWQEDSGGDEIFNKNAFAEFINNNPELEALSIGHIENTLLESMDERLDVLKDLQLVGARYVADLPQIDLKSLETLEIDELDAKCFSSILQALNRNAIKTLNLERYHGSVDGIIQDICSIKTLVSLRLHQCGRSITERQLRKLAIELPHLSDLSFRMKKRESNTIKKMHTMLSILPKLTKLTIKLDYDDFKRCLNGLKVTVYEFYVVLAPIHTEIEIDCGSSTASILEDSVAISDTGINLETDIFELYWMSNWNANSVREVIKRDWVDPTIFKLSNYSGRSFDISTLIHPIFKNTTTLDIKSNGPITVDRHATRYHGFFPKLKVLNIHLDHHSAIDFLHNLDKRVCKNIKTLKNIKGISTNPGVEHSIDMISILSKFENLESLHMTESSGEFNTKQLFSVCQKLTDVQI